MRHQGRIQKIVQGMVLTGVLLFAQIVCAVRSSTIVNDTDHAVVVQWEAFPCWTSASGVCHRSVLQPGERDSFDFVWGTSGFRIRALAMKDSFQEPDILFGKVIVHYTCLEGDCYQVVAFAPLSRILDFEFERFRREYVLNVDQTGRMSHDPRELSACMTEPEQNKTYHVTDLKMTVFLAVEDAGLSSVDGLPVYGVKRPVEVYFNGTSLKQNFFWDPREQESPSCQWRVED